MAETFFISDTHNGHEKTCTTFTRSDGSPLRPFASAEEMDEELVRRWNNIVRPQDKVYHLGDVSIKKRNLPLIGRMNGSKRLIRGNHDVFRTKEYLQYFKEVYGVRVFVDDFILSHIPLHPSCITTRFHVNVHGHTHANNIEIDATVYSHFQDCGRPTYAKKSVPDPRYFCVCVEQINYTPIHYDDLKNRIKANNDRYKMYLPKMQETEGPG